MTRLKSAKSGMLTERNAQAAAWGLLTLLVLVLLAGGLVDIYRLFAARNWAYAVAQEAALAGASRGRDWTAVASTGWMQLDAAVARSEAQAVVASAMRVREIQGYSAEVQVLPDPLGGSIPAFPPGKFRIGESLGDWSSAEPAVGVYLEVPVAWTLLELFGMAPREVRVFASAGVIQ